MNLAIYRAVALAFLTLLITGCSTAKLEARLEANPQCKEVINPKTGAAMPCPGSDKSFYKSVGLETSKPQVISSANPDATAIIKSSPEAITPTSKQTQPSTSKVSTSLSGCKPSLHKKTGNALPCPPID